MRRGWVLGFTLYVAFFALTIGLRWRQLRPTIHVILHGSPRTHSSSSTTGWRTASGTSAASASEILPPSSFHRSVSRHPYVSSSLRSATAHLCTGESFGGTSPPVSFHIWRLVWHGVIGWAFDLRPLLFRRRMVIDLSAVSGAFSQGFCGWEDVAPHILPDPCGMRTSRCFCPLCWLDLAEVIMAHALLRERHRRWITRSLPGADFLGHIYRLVIRPSLCGDPRV